MISNKGLFICLSKENVSVTFDQMIRTINGSVSRIKLAIIKSPVAFNALTPRTSGKSININNFHKMLGHCGSDRLTKTAKIHNFKVSGEF
jgi:hypothetical protein